MIGDKIAWDDTVLPFQLDTSDIRGRVARLDSVLNDILAQHNYPPAVEALVAEVTMLTALIGQTIKLRWKLSLQVRGNGGVRLIATDFIAPKEEGAPAQIRAYASFDPERVGPDMSLAEIAGDGYFAIMMDQGRGTTPYQGITPLSEKTITKCAEVYFAQSEQLPTRFELSVGKSTLGGEGEKWRAGGVMLQKMPEASPFAASQMTEEAEALLSAKDLLDGDDQEDWSRVNILLDSVNDFELVGPSIAPTDLLLRLFHEESPRVFDTQPRSFRV